MADSTREKTRSRWCWPPPLGYQRVAFADKLKDFAAAVYGIPRHVFDDPRLKNWDFKRTGETPRVFLQKLGQAAREIFGADFWVDRALDAVRARPEQRFVVTDVRHWNEISAVKELGGVVLRLNRADRREVHEVRTLSIAGAQSKDCQFVYFGGRMCGLPASSHPSHDTGEVHVSETALPDANEIYDEVFEAASGEAQAENVLRWLQQRGG